MMTKHPLFPLADTLDVDLEQAGGTNVAVDETFATAERFSSTAHPGPRSRRRSTGFVADLTGIVIVTVYACGGMGQNRTGRCP
jgi:hypothetical protein